MWTKTSSDRLEELGMTKKQIDEISNNSLVGVNIVTEVLLNAKRLGIITSLKNENKKLKLDKQELEKQIIQNKEDELNPDMLKGLGDDENMNESIKRFNDLI